MYQNAFNRKPIAKAFTKYMDLDNEFSNIEDFLYNEYYHKISAIFINQVNNLDNRIIQNENGTAETLDFWIRLHNPKIIKKSFKATSWLDLEDTWRKPIVDAAIVKEKELNEKYGIKFTRIFIVKDANELAIIKSSTAKKQTDNNINVKYVYVQEFDDNYIKDKMMSLRTKDFVIIDDTYLMQLFDENNDRKIRTSRFSKNSNELKSAIAVFNYFLEKAKDL